MKRGSLGGLGAAATPPHFLVSVASTGFSDFLSGLESIVTERFVSVASKGDRGLGGSGARRNEVATSCRTLGAADKCRNSELRAAGLKNKEQAEACSTAPHPRCFLQEWQAKDLCLTRRVRVANAGLKVFVLSCSCGEFVRVAKKELTAGEIGARREYRDEEFVGKGQPLQIT